tara:strand:+ start:2876 stop:3397 length:522 start_codon:yes stop_codon:yes gene_type:complete
MLKTKMARTTWSNIAICSLLDVALAYVIARVVSPDEVFVTTAILVVVIWLVPLVFIIKGNIYKTVLYHLNKSSVRTALVQEFREAKLPLLSGTDFNDPSDLYFNEVAADKTLPASATLYACMFVGQLSIIPKYSFVDAVVVSANTDAALATYFDEMRRDGVKPHKFELPDQIV